MGDVIVVTGPPGAGKSTVAALLAGLLDPSALVVGDDFFRFLRNGVISPWLEAAQQQNTAVIEAAAAASGRLSAHCAVVYDGVVGPWFLPTFLQASGLGQLHYAVLLPPLVVCVERIRTRTRHEFEDRDAAEHMWREFDQAAVDPRHVLSSETDKPADLAREIVEQVTQGAIRYP